MDNLLAEKQRQFNAAMDKYQSSRIYIWVGYAVSFVIISLQGVLAVLVFQQSIGTVKQIITFMIAYFLADFVSGLVHMYMDNNEDYLSFVGPLVASFHLHHRTPKYKQKPLISVYVHESGSKIWLAFFMIAVVTGVLLGAVRGAAAYGLFYFAVVSCVAEVSHYLCHVPPQSKITDILSKVGILMPAKYHLRHHVQDNVNYTFLNSMTDPIVDLIAKVLRLGYKNGTDVHYALYVGSDTENR